MKTILKAVAAVLGVIALAIVVLFVSMSVAQSPGFAWRVLRYGESDTQDYKIFPERQVENGPSHSVLHRGDQGTPFEVEYPYDGGTRREPLEELLRRTDTRAFLIVKDDRLIFETYLDSSRDAINTSFSAAKSFDFYAHGKYDQIVYVAPRKNVVIVRLGNAPDEKLIWVAAIRNFVDQLP